MAFGADKVISFSPPGAIGLTDPSPIILLRFDEELDEEFPRDAAGNLEDLSPAGGDAQVLAQLVMPVVTFGACGRARLFDPAVNWTGLGSRDRVSGSTLLTRDISIQVVLSWDAEQQDLGGAIGPGNIISRGVDYLGPPDPAQFVSWGLQIDVVNAATFTGQLRWIWQDVAGVVKLQTGAQFTIMPTQFTMLTATRRWISPTEVLMRYYIGDLLIGEVTSVDGSIGGGTTGTTQIGTRGVGAVNERFFAGVIDEIMVLGRELTLEEIEATWLRITRYQPLGYQLLREMHDQGFPLPSDLGSDVQMDLRMTGNALGYAAAIAEDVRSNILPQRAYGSVLEEWETACRVTPEPKQDVDTRRSRVLAKIRQRRGSSIPGLQDALVGLLGGGASDDLEFVAFDNTVRDGFSEMETERWDISPAASWAAPAGTARSSPAAGTYLMSGVDRNWLTARISIGGLGRQAHVLSKIAMTTPQAGLEVGIFMADYASNHFLLLGLRDDAGTFKIVTEGFIASISQGLVVQATPGANPANLWLHLYQTSTDGTWKAARSTTSGTTGFTVGADIIHPTEVAWAGMYVRSTAATAGAAQVNVDDLVVRSPFDTRPFNAYVLLDDSLGFSPDIFGAHSVVSSIGHAFVHSAFITSRSLLCDDVDSGCDMGPMGGI